MGDLHVEVLGRQHRGLVRGFENQHPALVEYLQRYAIRHAEKDLLARTYAAIDGDRIAGYFSLTTVSIDRSSAGDLPALARLPRFPIPGVLLARLAVDRRAQGQGLGRYLFEEALGITLTLARTGPVAFRLLVTDPIDSDAERFYSRLGLVRLASAAPRRMVLDLGPLVGR